MSASEGFVKLDFSNAFNCVSRDAVIHPVAELVPPLTPYVICSYSQPAILQFGSWTLNSCDGVQQKDPLGLMLFAHAIKHISHSCTSPLRIWYLDDCFLAGKVFQVGKDVKQIIQLGNLVGLHLNVWKCEIVSSDKNFRNELLSILTGAKTVNINDVTLLRAGLSIHASTSLLRNLLHKMCQTSTKLSECEPHDAYYIVLRAKGSPKLTYLLRTSLCFSDNEVLNETDKQLSNALSTLFSID